MELTEDENQEQTEGNQAVDSQSRTYTIDFYQKDKENTYSNISFINYFPEAGFELKEGSIKVYKKAEDGFVLDEALTKQATPAQDGKSFTISIPSITKDEEYQVKFSGTQVELGAKDSSGNVIKEIKNSAVVTYNEITGDSTEKANGKGNSITYTERITNEVTTDVTHLYLNVEKEIPVEDENQTFLFKIERFNTEQDAKGSTATPEEVFYTEVHCTEAEGSTDDTAYIGNSLVQLDKRGYYRISEVTDWSKTDYVYSSYVSGYKSGKTESAVLFIAADMLKPSKAIPTIAGYPDAETCQTIRFVNQESPYAFYSGQAYSENKIGVNQE
jgi:hypothetical protein